MTGGEGTPVVGGCGPNCGAVLFQRGTYDPVTDAWTALPDMHAARAWATATLLNNGLVLVAGGNSVYDPDAETVVPTTSVDLFDPATNTWSSAASMATARYEHVASRLSDGRVLVAGGIRQQRRGVRASGSPIDDRFVVGRTRHEHHAVVRQCHRA